MGPNCTLVSRGRNNASTGHIKSLDVKKSFRMMRGGASGGCFEAETAGTRRDRLYPRQQQFGPQPSNRRAAKRKAAAVERRKVDHDRQAEPRARLGLVEPLTAA